MQWDRSTAICKKKKRGGGWFGVVGAMKACMRMCSKVWSVVCPVRRRRWRGSRAWKSLLSLFGETNSHFISCGADHHTSVATHSAVSAAAQTCHFHLYGSIRRRRGPQTGSDTCLARAPHHCVKCAVCGAGCGE